MFDVDSDFRPHSLSLNIGSICAVSFAAVSNLKHVVTKYFDTKMVGKKVKYNEDSLDCKFVF